MSAAAGPVRIGLVASTFGMGGAERVTADVVRRLPRERFETRLYFVREAGPVGRELLEAGHGGGERLAKRRHDPRALPRLLVRFRSFRPHVVFCMDHHNAMVLGRVAGIACGTKALVVASHSTGLFGRSRNLRWTDRVLMEFTARVVAVSRTHARYLREREGVEPSRITVIENGIDLSQWPPADGSSRAAARRALGIGPDEPVVLMVAALRPEKAHEALLRAVARLRDGGRKVLALLAGDGERRAELEALARSLGIGGSVQFLGLRRDVARLLHASDVVVLPSHGVVETLPLAVLEAMAAGVPVVASAVGSLPEVIDSGRNGLLIPPADDVELGKSIGYILDNEAAAARFREAARRTAVERFGIERTTARYGELFEELAA